MNLDFACGAFVGGLCGLSFGMWMMIATDESLDRIHECQKELPRNVRCVLVAVPDQERNQ